MRYELFNPSGVGQGSDIPLQTPPYRHQPQAPSVARQSTQLREEQDTELNQDDITVKPPNKGHYVAKDFVPCREVVPISEVEYYTISESMGSVLNTPEL